ncbi:MAG: hypothetical protein HWN67_20950, partial [Candidatus Helarchaeota archaeon]|nr:hypothetical protein [Candidatus Helarchaeota archaeon]
MNRIKLLIILLLSIFIIGLEIKLFGQELTGDEIDRVIKKMTSARFRHRFMGDLMTKQFLDRQPRILKKRIWFDSPDRIRDEIIFPAERRSIIRILNGDNFETIVDGKSILSRKRRYSKHRFPFLERIRENFDIDVVDGGIIAERETKLIVMKPKLKGRLNFKYWIDNETGIILKKKILRSNGENLIPVYEKYFTDIDYKPPMRPDLFRVKKRKIERKLFPPRKTVEYKTIEQAIK